MDRKLLIGIVLLIVIAAGVMIITQKEPISDSADDVSRTDVPDTTEPANDVSFDIAGNIITLKDKSKVLPTLQEAQLDFVETFIEVINDDDLEALKELTHNASLECIAAVDPEYQAHFYDQVLRYTIADSYAIAFERYTPVFEESFQKNLDAWFKDPIKNTHMIFFNYNDFKMGNETIQQKLVEEEGGYKILFGCPTEATVSQYIDGKRAMEEAQAKFDEIYPTLDENFKRMVIKVLKEGDTGKAYQLLSEKITEEDGPAMGMVMQKLETIANEELRKEAPQNNEGAQ